MREQLNNEDIQKLYEAVKKLVRSEIHKYNAGWWLYSEDIEDIIQHIVIECWRYSVKATDKYFKRFVKGYLFRKLKQINKERRNMVLYDERNMYDK